MHSERPPVRREGPIWSDKMERTVCAAGVVWEAGAVGEGCVYSVRALDEGCVLPGFQVLLSCLCTFCEIMIL